LQRAASRRTPAVVAEAFSADTSTAAGRRTSGELWLAGIVTSHWRPTWTIFAAAGCSCTRSPKTRRMSGFPACRIECRWSCSACGWGVGRSDGPAAAADDLDFCGWRLPRVPCCGLQARIRLNNVWVVRCLPVGAAGVLCCVNSPTRAAAIPPAQWWGGCPAHQPEAAQLAD